MARSLLFPPTDEPPWRLRVLSVGSLTIDERWDSAGVFSSFWRLYAVRRAGSEVRWRTGRHAVLPDRVHLIPAWFAFDCYNDRPVPHLYAHFDAVGPAAVVLSESLSRPIGLPRDAALDEAGSELEKQLQRGGFELTCRTLAEAWVRLALARCVENWSEGQLMRAHGQDPDEAAIAPALTYIEEHLAERFTNADLAKRCAMSEDHFIRRFRQAVGQPPARYATQRRIARAVPMLLHSDWPIERIAQAVGFADRFHFSRVFAARMGTPPARYRQTQRW